MMQTQEERRELLESRRLRRILISFELWRAFVRGELYPSSRTSCPDDLEVVDILGLYPSSVRWGDVAVLAWSSEFEPIPKGDHIPQIDVIYSVEYLHVRRERLEEESGE